jgi:hypothetical protein
LADIRDDGIIKAKAALSFDPDRFALFSPGAGAGRSVRFASTSVIVDDAFAFTGTTHLWRRGLTFDSSIAAAVFDERLVDGRPQEIRTFRRRLLAGRLGLQETKIPDDPGELVGAIRDLDLTSSFRLAARPILPPARIVPTDDYPKDGDRAVWDPDGVRTATSFSLVNIITFFLQATAGPNAELNDPLPPS